MKNKNKLKIKEQKDFILFNEVLNKFHGQSTKNPTINDLRNEINILKEGTIGIKTKLSKMEKEKKLLI